MDKFDFSGYATRNDLLCGDGRTIRKDAFKDCDGVTVPLVYNHDHKNTDAVLGHALLENREDGVYAYGVFNDTESGLAAKKLVQHGDVRSLSIYANKLKQLGNDVIHGTIRELSLVLAGANPGAYIDFVMAHSDDGDDTIDGFEASYDENIMLYHSDDKNEKKNKEMEDKEMEDKKKNKEMEDKKKNKETEDKKKNTPEENSEETVADVFNTLSEKQKKVVYAMLGQALEDAGVEDDENSEEETDMKHNVFDNDEFTQENVLSHDAMNEILSDGKRFGSLKESFLAHTEEYGIQDIDFLFPEAKTLNNPPEFIQRDTGWVSNVMAGVHHTPFSRIKSQFANITEEDARAKGYMKGNLKKEEVFSLLKRTTTPTTIYKKQKLDRDDIIDITDFDVVAWLKSEMRLMLDEELARAFILGDGRIASSDDKINEANIRPIIKDADLYTVKKQVAVAHGATDETKAKAFIKAVIKARKDYKGSGNPSLYTTEGLIADCLLIEDSTGRAIYESEEKLRNVLRVKEIIPMEVMENANGYNGKPLMAVLVNLNDYNVGADKGGAINMFDDFDIDYNQQKYLIETRCSGALTKPYSAITFECDEAAS